MGRVWRQDGDVDLKCVVMEQNIDIPEKGFVPRFRNKSLRKGVVTFICKDEASDKWLWEVVLAFHLEDGSKARLFILTNLSKW